MKGLQFSLRGMLCPKKAHPECFASFKNKVRKHAARNVVYAKLKEDKFTTCSSYFRPHKFQRVMLCRTLLERMHCSALEVIFSHRH